MKTFIANKPLKAKIEQMADIQSVVENLADTVLIRFHNQQTLLMIKGVSSNFASSDGYRATQGIDNHTFYTPNSGKYSGIIDLHSSKQLRLPLKPLPPYGVDPQTREQDTTLTVFYPKKI